MSEASGRAGSAQSRSGPPLVLNTSFLISWSLLSWELITSSTSAGGGGGGGERKHMARQEYNTRIYG